MTAKDRWSLRNIYLYLVCLITLIMVIVAVVGAVRNVAELIYPDPYGSREFPAPVAEEGQTAEQLEKDRELQAESQRRWAILGLVGNIAMLGVAGPIYVYHWRKIETEAPAVAREETAISGQ